MVNIAVVGHNEQDRKQIVENLIQMGHLVVSTRPELVISYGGDGSFFYAEHKYPGVAKIITRNKSICNLCKENKTLKQIIQAYTNNDYSIKKIPYLEIDIKHSDGKINKLFAVSDVTIRNSEQFHAIRFDIKTSDRKVKHLIADGIVSANELGLKGYFYSITKKVINPIDDLNNTFATAINNSTLIADDYFIDKKIQFTLKRNKASITVDNVKKIISLQEGDKVSISLSEKTAQIIEFEKNNIAGEIK